MRQSESILRKRLRKFRRLKRGYYSFLIVAIAYGISFFLPLLANNRALVVHYQGHYFFRSPDITRRRSSDARRSGSQTIAT